MAKLNIETCSLSIKMTGYFPPFDLLLHPRNWYFLIPTLALSFLTSPMCSCQFLYFFFRAFLHLQSSSIWCFITIQHANVLYFSSASAKRRSRRKGVGERKKCKKRVGGTKEARKCVSRKEKGHQCKWQLYTIHEHVPCVWYLRLRTLNKCKNKRKCLCWLNTSIRLFSIFISQLPPFYTSTASQSFARQLPDFNGWKLQQQRAWCGSGMVHGVVVA